MIGSELAMLLLHYPDCEIIAPNLEHLDLEPVTAIAFDAASHAIELRTSRKLPVIREKKAEENRWVEKFKFPVKTKESWWVETHRFSCAPWGYTVDVVKVGENDTMVSYECEKCRFINGFLKNAGEGEFIKVFGEHMKEYH